MNFPVPTDGGGVSAHMSEVSLSERKEPSVRKLPLNQIVCGDCLEAMKAFPSESVDLVATDPPYGYSFMGKHTLDTHRKARGQK